METQKMLTFEERESMRKAAMDEVGSAPPCPFCQRPLVSGSSYIRCNPCGVNWSPGEEISLDPRTSRTKATASTSRATVDTAETVR